MKTKEFVLKIADLFLLSDEGTAEWVNIKALRHAWYVFFSSVTTLVVFILLANAYWPIDVLRTSAKATLIFRATHFVFYVLASASLISMTFHYFRYVVTNNYAVHFTNIVYFYLLHVILWGYMYRCIYLLFQGSFTYVDAPVVYTPTLLDVPLMVKLRTSLDFMLFSALQSVNSSFYRITPNSIIPSIFAWVQSLYTLSLVALLLASYVNQKAHPKGNTSK